MATAFTFPGQGSQSVGMGLALAETYPAARAVFDEVDEALGERLSRLIFEGPEDELRLTANAQPALMAVSLAAMRALAAEGVAVGSARLVAGHSLGEYSALAAAGAISVRDAARLLRLRGRAMQEAVTPGEGAMAALLGLDVEAALEVAATAADGDVCEVANDNAPGQCVVSGDRVAVERAIELARGRGAKRSILLPVSAPFHSSLMVPAAEAMAEALASTPLRAPSVPLLANVSARLLQEPAAIRQSLVEQVTGRVRWRESVASFAPRGIVVALEIGAGKVLSGLARRIDKTIEPVAINTPQDVQHFLSRAAAA